MGSSGSGSPPQRAHRVRPARGNLGRGGDGDPDAAAGGRAEQRKGGAGPVSGIEDSGRRPLRSTVGPGLVGMCAPLPLPSAALPRGFRTQPAPPGGALSRLPHPARSAARYCRDAVAPGCPTSASRPSLDTGRAEFATAPWVWFSSLGYRQEA